MLQSRRRLLRCGHGYRVAGAILGNLAKSRPREVRATDHHLVGNHPIKQLAAAGLGHRCILVEDPVPPRMLGAQRRHVGGVAGNHQLFIARADVESGMAGRVTGRADKVDPGHDLIFALNGKHVLPHRDDGLNAMSKWPAPLGQPAGD